MGAGNFFSGLLGGYTGTLVKNEERQYTQDLAAAEMRIHGALTGLRNAYETKDPKVMSAAAQNLEDSINALQEVGQRKKKPKKQGPHSGLLQSILGAMTGGGQQQQQPPAQIPPMPGVSQGPGGMPRDPGMSATPAAGPPSTPKFGPLPQKPSGLVGLYSQFPTGEQQAAAEGTAKASSINAEVQGLIKFQKDQGINVSPEDAKSMQEHLAGIVPPKPMTPAGGMSAQEAKAVEELVGKPNPETKRPYTREEAVARVRQLSQVGRASSVEMMELQDYMKKTGKGPLDFLKMKSNLSGATVPLTPAAIEMLARQTRQTGQIPSISWGKAGANLKAQIANKAAADAPAADLATNAANYKSLTASLRQTQEQATKLNAFETVADRNLMLMMSKAAPLSDTGSPWLNMTVRQLQLRGAGNPDVAAFISAWTVASNEVSRVLNQFGGGGVLSDAARAETHRILDPNSTLAQLKASADVLQSDMKNRRDGFNETITLTQDSISKIGNVMKQQSSTPANAISYKDWK